VALPAIAVGSSAGPAGLGWVVSGYALAFGLALVPAGRLGDRFGSKQLFLTGMAIYMLASAGCGLTQSPAELIAARQRRRGRPWGSGQLLSQRGGRLADLQPQLLGGPADPDRPAAVTKDTS
jgi:MFS family permease